MNILGISCFFHDSAACLVQDGIVSAAVQEERFTRKKHDFSFPLNSVNWCLKEGKIKISDIDYVVFYEKPFIKFERLLETSLSFAPGGITQFIHSMPLWLKQKLWTPEIIRKELGYKGEILFCGHHESHAASAFYPSAFKESAFLTIDGVGEWETASFGEGRFNDLKILHYLRFPHSLGLLYSAFTYFLGFKVNSGEYKMMGLAPYGQPKYTSLILNTLVDLKEDGSFKLNMEYFGYCNSLRMTNSKFHRLFGMDPRKPETKLLQEHMDIAASVQNVTEEVVLRMARHVKKVTGQDNLCLAGGVALNCVANGKILSEGIFNRIWVQPASGDAGGALGAALFTWYKYLGNNRDPDNINDSQKCSLLGPSFDDEYIESFLKEKAVPYKKLDFNDIPKETAVLVEKGNVIGWFQGRLEFGPRALGSRSIIADARNRQMQQKLNLKIKFRESFRPFAPVVLEKEAPKWFDLDKESPYMLIVALIKNDKRTEVPCEIKNYAGFDKLKLNRSLIPAVTHVDYSARIQTVSKETNPFFYELISEFNKITGCPVIINTSFNVRGEPLVMNPEDAFRCFMRTEMDYLVIGSFLLDKKEQKELVKDNAWQKEFELD